MPIGILANFSFLGFFGGWSWFMLPWAFCAEMRALSSSFSSFFNGINQLCCSLFPPIAIFLSLAHVVLAIRVSSDKNCVGVAFLGGERHWFSFYALSSWPISFVFLSSSDKLSVLPRFTRFFNIEAVLSIFGSIAKWTCFSFLVSVLSIWSSPLEEYWSSVLYSGSFWNILFAAPITSRRY